MFIRALRETLKTRACILWFVVLVIATFGLIAYLPVRLIPGNDLAFQLKLFTARDFVLFGALAVLNALLIMMQVHIARERHRVKARLGVAGAGSVGGLFAAATASLFGAASCASCVAAVFGFLGLGNVLFLLDHRGWVVGITLALLVVAIYFSARRINNKCASCKV